MPCPDVEFRDSENGQPCHKYYLDGKEIPGLSYILDSCGLCRYDKARKDVMEAARERGDAAHYASKLFDEDYPKKLVGTPEMILPEWEEDALTEPLDPWTRSRMIGWLKFRVDFGYMPILTEKAMSHCLHGMPYAFTLDSYGVGSPGNMLIEKKCTSAIEPSHAIQTAAQALPFKESNVGRYVVQLGDGDYKIIECKDRQDEKLFGCALALCHWRWNHGIK